MLATLLFWLAALTLLGWALSALDLALGYRTLAELRREAPLAGDDAPPVSVVIAARNEARRLETALRSVLAQRYARLEVIVVDDRSDDATGEILDRMARETPALRVLHLTELPDGWLGKNHALQRGAEVAGGEWLLFTDADVEFDPLAVARAVGYATRAGLDHLAVAPELTMPSRALDLFAGTFALLFAQHTRPWKAPDPRSGRHIGVGAFNMVRRSAYRAIDGHRRLALRPDDDLKLGKVLKTAGCRQALAFGRGMVRVEWYSSVREAVRGLEKNTFAGLGYSVPAVLGAVVMILLFNVWPFLGVLLTDGATRLLNAATVAVVLAIYAASTRASGSDPRSGLAFPLGSLLLAYIIVRATTLTLLHGGIRWRGTRYPLDRLRANRV